ncbi:hypothetical protein [Bradyrhizobium sp.]|uniref:hypothetical protein n=1 Tax=Bradyrhizobium sp. TaxID=376 RepID=UPI0012E7EE20|nr:hypothetical protein [Bradyrhizobium sp.]
MTKKLSIAAGWYFMILPSEWRPLMFATMLHDCSRVTSSPPRSAQTRHIFNVVLRVKMRPWQRITPFWSS